VPERIEHTDMSTPEGNGVCGSGSDGSIRVTSRDRDDPVRDASPASVGGRLQNRDIVWPRHGRAGHYVPTHGTATAVSAPAAAGEQASSPAHGAGLSEAKTARQLFALTPTPRSQPKQSAGLTAGHQRSRDAHRTFVPFGDFESAAQLPIDAGPRREDRWHPPRFEPSAPRLSDSGGHSHSPEQRQASKDLAQACHAAARGLHPSQRTAPPGAPAPPPELAPCDVAAAASSMDTHSPAAAPAQILHSAWPTPGSQPTTQTSVSSLTDKKSEPSTTQFLTAPLRPHERTHSEVVRDHLNHAANEQVQYILDGPFRDEELRDKLISVRAMLRLTVQRWMLRRPACHGHHCGSQEPSHNATLCNRAYLVHSAAQVIVEHRPSPHGSRGPGPASSRPAEHDKYLTDIEQAMKLSQCAALTSSS
jgi:hypothetical protein